MKEIDLHKIFNQQPFEFKKKCIGYIPCFNLSEHLLSRTHLRPPMRSWHLYNAIKDFAGGFVVVDGIKFQIFDKKTLYRELRFVPPKDGLAHIISKRMLSNGILSVLWISSDGRNHWSNYDYFYYNWSRKFIVD